MHSECGGSQMAGGCGGSNPDREDMIRQKLNELDERERIATADARGLTLSLLTQKGFTEIDEAPRFEVSTPRMKAMVSIDFIVRIGGWPFMAVKCSMAVDSRERHVLAFARAATPDVISFALVTDGIKAHMLDTLTGRLLSEGVDTIPSIEEASRLLESGRVFPQEQPLSQERLRRERMVLLAFESASCPPIAMVEEG